MKYKSDNNEFISNKTPAMLNSQSNIKNRRSVSVISQQQSKRSSMSMLNIQESIMNSNHQQPSFQGNVKVYEKYDSLWEDLLPGLKNKLVESYRVVKKHVKDEIYEFDKVQLGVVYRGMSNGLKTLQTVVEYVEKIKKELLNSQIAINQFTSSYKMAKPQHQQHSKHHITQSQQAEPSQYIQLIHSLQSQIQQQREKHSQQIRLMIQNHQEEMMFVEQEQNLKFNNIKKEHQQQMESILQAHKKREQEIKSQSARRVNEMVKAKFENLRAQEVARLEQVMKEYELKEDKYKGLIKKLSEKLNQSRTVSQNLAKKLEGNLLKTRSVVQKILKSSTNQTKTDNYLKVLSQKLGNILSQQFPICEDFKLIQKKPPTSFPNPTSMPYSMMAIQQMFMKSGDDSVLEGHNNHFQLSLQALIEKLVWLGFFWEDNEENVVSLFNIARQRSSDDNFNPSTMLSHTLYPLIIQKIKLALSKLEPIVIANMKDSFNPLVNSHQPSTITQFSTQHPNNKLQFIPIRYRNIQSIEELEVSDSMICDESGEKEKRIGGAIDFENHSPIVNYKGYETPEEGYQSASFDVDLF